MSSEITWTQLLRNVLATWALIWVLGAVFWLLVALGLVLAVPAAIYAGAVWATWKLTEG